jgi:hypothetical protein
MGRQWDVSKVTHLSMVCMVCMVCMVVVRGMTQQAMMSNNIASLTIIVASGNVLKILRTLSRCLVLLSAALRSNSCTARERCKGKMQESEKKMVTFFCETQERRYWN